MLALRWRTVTTSDHPLLILLRSINWCLNIYILMNYNNGISAEGDFDQWGQRTIGHVQWRNFTFWPPPARILSGPLLSPLPPFPLPLPSSPSFFLLSPPIPSSLLPLLTSPPLRSKTPPLPFPSPLPLEVGPLNPARGSGERCKLPQWGLGRSRQTIWCISGPKGAAQVATVLWIFVGINLIFWWH